jgi:rhodanese-related sulfurtransferase
MGDADLSIEVSCAEVAGMLAAGERFALIDCREPDEADICRIDGAELIPMSTLADRVGELAGHEGERIVVYCHLGGRSYRVANWLRQQGFAHAQSMAGGIDEWADEIEPGMARY